VRYQKFHTHTLSLTHTHTHTNTHTHTHTQTHTISHTQTGAQTCMATCPFAHKTCCLGSKSIHTCMQAHATCKKQAPQINALLSLTFFIGRRDYAPYLAVSAALRMWQALGHDRCRWVGDTLPGDCLESCKDCVHHVSMCLLCCGCGCDWCKSIGHCHSNNMCRTFVCVCVCA